MSLESELREVIGALQSEAEFEAVVSELGASGIDRARMSFLAQEDIAAFCAGAGAVLAATGGAAAPALLAGLASGGSVGGLAALFGRRHEGHLHEWAESQILNGGIVLIVHTASAEQFEAATAIMRRHCGADVFASPPPTSKWGASS